MSENNKTFLQKYDMLILKTSMIVAICTSLFHIYTSVFGILEAWRHRSIHVVFILILSCLSNKKLPRKFTKQYQFIMIILTAIVSIYILKDYNSIIYREAIPSHMDRIIGTILILIVIESSRRWVGASMAIVASVFFLYAMFGYLIPGKLTAPHFSYNRIIAQLFNSTSGLFGSTSGVAATSVIIFILFGTFLDKSGGSDFFNDFSLVLTKRVKGGPAKAAVVASALVGTIQGNAISNVVTTGTFTIPLMIRSGYSPVYAGAVESAASTGGMIMPPVMGAAAFILAEMTGTPYSTILIYAILPACLYYLGIFLMVHLHAIKYDIKPLVQNTKLNKRELFWQGMTCLGPMILLVYLLLNGSSPMRSATLAIGFLVLIWIIRPVKRLKIKELINALEEGSKSMISVSSACVTAGIVIGCLSLTGLATKIAVLVGIAGTSQWIVLILSMIVCIIFGMGLPVTASYVISVITLGSIFKKVGIPLVQGHLFLMYFSTISAITPPVALASYAAAGIANTSPNKVGWQAFKLALPGFLIPYVFVFGKELLLIGDSIDIILTIISSSVGMLSLAISMEGFFFTNVDKLSRLLYFIASIFMIIVDNTSDIIGYAVFIILTVINYRNYKKIKLINNDIDI